MRELSTYPQVLESIQRDGQLLPVYLWSGAILDGEKRHRACLESGLEPSFHTLTDEHAAASLLWSLHPQRALAMFGHGRTFVDLVVLFGAKPTSLKAVMREQEKREPKPKRNPRRRFNYRMTVRFPVDAQRIIYATAKESRCDRQEVIIAAVRAATPEALERELRRLRRER